MAKNIMKIPSNRLEGVINEHVRRLNTFSRVVFEQATFNDLSFSIAVSQDFITLVADSVISMIQLKGNQGKAKKHFGPNWAETIRKSIYCEYLAAINIAWTIQTNPYLSWDRITEYYGSFKVTQGSSYLFMILSSNLAGFQVPNSGFRFNYEVNLRDPSYILDVWAKKVFTSDEYEKYSSKGWKSSECFGTLQIISDELIEEFVFITPAARSGRDPLPCITDLVLPKTTSEEPLYETTGTGSYHVLNTQGLSDVTIAFALVFRTFFSGPTTKFGKFDLLNNYSLFTGEPYPGLRENQILIWTGFKYGLPDLRPSGPTDFVEPSLGPSSPPSSDSGQTGPSPLDPKLSRPRLKPSPGSGSNKPKNQSPSLETISEQSDSSEQDYSVSNQIVSHPIIIDSDDLEQALETAKTDPSFITKAISGLKSVVDPAVKAATLFYVMKAANRPNPDYSGNLESTSVDLGYGPLRIGFQKGKTTLKPNVSMASNRTSKFKRTVKNL